ncbi:unnamed protein product [Cyprideis torosa]|uniref:Uncharacterized protein n=1 Tax=Cyprideis torosa TaxID=163714 RepID=A0A7R8W4E2_9CRUS|nr:unnamed protein product [Cyprideis torosa]CAG0883932.1 unnamed protein product [Cyprideis torosa]
MGDSWMPDGDEIDRVKAKYQISCDISRFELLPFCISGRIASEFPSWKRLRATSSFLWFLPSKVQFVAAILAPRLLLRRRDANRKPVGHQLSASSELAVPPDSFCCIQSNKLGISPRLGNSEDDEAAAAGSPPRSSDQLKCVDFNMGPQETGETWIPSIERVVESDRRKQ